MKNYLIFLLLFPVMIWSQSDFSKAENLFETAKYDQARLLFENYSKENPNHLKTLEYLGDIAGNNKSWDKAILYYKKLKQLKPN